MKNLCKLLCFFTCLLSLHAVAQDFPSADSVLARYVEVIGGKGRWAAIKTSEFHVKTTFDGQSMDVLIIKLGPGKYYQSLIGSGIEIKEVYNNGKAYNIINGKQEEVTDLEQLDHYELQSQILPDASYAKLNYKREMFGIDTINGVEYYVVVLTSKNGSQNINYYEKATGLLKIIDKKGHRHYMDDYKPFNGCLVPMVMVSDMGEGRTMKSKVVDWLINQKTDASVFDVKRSASIAQ